MSDTNQRTLELIRQLTSKNSQSSRWENIQSRVGILCSNTALKNKNGQLALTMAVNCLTRSHPIITDIDIILPYNPPSLIDSPLFFGKNIRDGLRNFLDRLQSLSNVNVIESTDKEYDVILSIGNNNVTDKVVSITSDGWIAYVAPFTIAKEFGDKINPVGAFFAANLGSSEVFKTVFLAKADKLNPEKSKYDFRWRTRLLENDIKFNTYDYSINGNTKNPALPNTVNFSNIMLVGSGAGGGACLYTISELDDITGKIVIIDPDEVNHTNLNRYVWASKVDAEKNIPKTEVAERLFENKHKVKIVGNHLAYKKYKEESIESFDVVISTVDNAKTRLAIQWDLPKVILDAAVASSSFYVNTVKFGENACLGCRFAGIESNSEDGFSEITGIPPSEIEILVENNGCFTAYHIDLMKDNSEKLGFPLPKEGDHFQDWVIQHCGTLSIPDKDVEIPLPFATIAPGILLAGELIKNSCYQTSFQEFFSYDLFGLRTDGINSINRIDDCPICGNDLVIKRFLEKYSIENPKY